MEIPQTHIMCLKDTKELKKASFFKDYYTWHRMFNGYILMLSSHFFQFEIVKPYPTVPMLTS